MREKLLSIATLAHRQTALYPGQKKWKRLMSRFDSLPFKIINLRKFIFLCFQTFRQKIGSVTSRLRKVQFASKLSVSSFPERNFRLENFLKNLEAQGPFSNSGSRNSASFSRLYFPASIFEPDHISIDRLKHKKGARRGTITG